MSDQVRVVRRRDLMPIWTLPGATQDGSRRWLISYVGGPPGYYNNNPEFAVESERMIVGYLGLGAGQRQLGVHRHTVTEIYVMLSGEVASIDHTGEEHAGHMDCLYIPVGVDHAVRNTGTGEAGVFFIHDALEPKGSAIYTDQPAPGPDKVHLIRAVDLTDDWALPEATRPPHLRSAVTWVAGANGYPNTNPGRAIENQKVSLGRLTILAGNRQPRHSMPAAITYLVAEGACCVDSDAESVRLGPMDAAHITPGTPYAIRALSTSNVSLIFTLDRPIARDSVTWA